MSTIFLAGAEHEQATYALLDNGVRNILYSFYYIHYHHKDGFIQRVLRDNPQVRFFLDSGAFTFAQTSHGEVDAGAQSAYLEAYFNFIEATKGSFIRIAEPDFDSSTMSVDQVTRIREAMLEQWPELNIVPVYHPWRGIDAWHQYCDDPRIKAVGVGMGKYSMGELRKLVMYAHLRGKPVHGFGMTRIASTAKVVPFDTIDSISWVAGQKFGVSYLFKGGKFITLTVKNQGKERRRHYRKYYESIGCDFQKILVDDVAEVRKANIIAWRNLSARLEEMRKREHRNFTERSRFERINYDANVAEASTAFGEPAKPREQLELPEWGKLRTEEMVGLGYDEREIEYIEQWAKPRDPERVPEGPRERAPGSISEPENLHGQLRRTDEGF